MKETGRWEVIRHRNIFIKVFWEDKINADMDNKGDLNLYKTDKYNDIIDLPHPISKKHKRMTVSERAARFMPFSPLKGYESMLSDTAKNNDDRMNNETEYEEYSD